MKAVTVSYVPLLYEWPGKPFEINSDSFRAFAKKLEEAPGPVAGCAWMEPSTPVFIIEQAQAIHEHLLAWSEERPEKWFSLQVRERPGAYAAVLVPDLFLSAARWRQAYPGLEPGPVLFKPLGFAGPDDTFRKIERTLRRQVVADIGLLPTWPTDEEPFWLRGVPIDFGPNEWDSWVVALLEEP